MSNFWQKLHKPFFVLAPMADVTDCAFRQMIAAYGKPDVFWTEFVAADGLAHPVAREKLLIDLKYGENERPIVAQIFGSKPDNIREAAKLCKELGFDGIDINMGCPDKSVEKQCAGAAMIKDPTLAKAVIRAAKEGAGDLPVSVKTRIGYNKNEIETWIRGLLSENIAALTVHLRTRKEMSNVPAHWDYMKRIVEIRDEVSPDTLILGNGDVMNLDEAKQRVAETGCDGVMLGRAIFGNPWLFAEHSPLEFFVPEGLASSPERPKEGAGAKNSEGRSEALKERLGAMIEHTKIFEEMLGQYKNFAIMKKHYKAYVNGFDGAKELRMKLMEAENAGQVAEITDDFLANI